MAQEHFDRLTAIDASFLAQEGADVAHAHRRADDLRGPAAAVRRVPGHHPRAPAPRPALPPEAELPARRDRPAGLGRRPELQPRVPRAPDRAAAPRAARSQLFKLVSRIFSQQLDRSKPLWEMWVVEGLEGGRFALISKTHHAVIDGISGVDLATVLFDLTPEPREVEHPDEAWEPAAEPTAAALVASGARRHRADGRRAPRAASRGSRRVRRRPRAEVRDGLEGIGEIVWAGLNPAPDTPLNVEIGPHRRYRVVADRPRRLQARSRTRSAAPSTTSCSRSSAARCASGCARAACAPRASSCARSCPCRCARAGRARRARQPDRRDARPAARLRRRPGRAPARRAPGDGRAEGVQAGGRRRGARRRAGLRAADDARAGLAAELLHAPLQPDRDERARARSSRSTSRAARWWTSSRSRSCRRTTRSRSRS